jgi:hypothetical protein
MIMQWAILWHLSRLVLTFLWGNSGCKAARVLMPFGHLGIFESASLLMINWHAVVHTPQSLQYSVYLVNAISES